MIRRIRAWFANRLIWQKMLLLYLSISVVPISLISLFSYSISKDIMHTQVTTRLYEITSDMAMQIRRSQKGYETLLDKLAYDDAFLKRLTLLPQPLSVLEELTVQCRNTLRDLQAIAEEVLDIRIALPGQDELLPIGDVQDETADQTIRRTLTYRQFGDQELVFFDVRQSYTYVYRRIINPYTGRDAGVLVLLIDAAKFFSGLSIESSQEYAFVVQDENGDNLYAETRLKAAYGGIYPKTLQRSQGNEIRIMHDTFIYEPYYMEDFGWNICLLIPKNILYAGFSDIILTVVAIAGGLILLVSAAAVWMSYNMSRRLNSISAEMDHIGSGRLEVNLDLPSGGDEIGHLVGIFHGMVDKINTLIIDQYVSEIRQKEAQLKILQAQINPHFLYNCMDTINWRAIMNGDEKTSAVATNLSVFYRTCLNKGQTKIHMKDELKNARAYLQLQEDLHDNSFDVEYDIDERVNDYEGINLMLQPLVENALEHGIEKQPGKRGVIRVTAALCEEEPPHIRLSVFNSGPPIIREVARSALADTGSGYGLANVNNRIKLFFGQEYGVNIHPESQGTACVIVIPARRWEEPAPAAKDEDI